MRFRTHVPKATVVAGTVSAVVMFAAPAAYAAPVDAATFSGTFTSTCTMPYGIEGPVSGVYTCQHKATSLSCAAVADTGSVVTYVKICRADLTSGSTSGHATALARPMPLWACDNGAGTGTVRYQPSSAEAAFLVPVNLVVIGSDVVVSGSWTQAGTNRHIVVRAEFPAVCAASTTGGGYAGTVTPV